MTKRRGRPEAHDQNWTHPPCLGCGGPVQRKIEEDGKPEKMSAWIGRRGCSARCAGIIANEKSREQARARMEKAIRDHLPCASCGGAIIPHEDETLLRYRERSTCSTDCRKKVQSVNAQEANLRRRENNQTTSRKAMSLDNGNGFVGSFGDYDVDEKPSYGRIAAKPAHRTYGGVVSYG